MHSLRPSGDNIAHEFLKLMGQKNLTKTASIEDADAKTAEDQIQQLSEIEESNKSLPSEREVLLETFASPLEQFNEPDDANDDLMDMITDESDDQSFSKDFAAIDEAQEAFASYAPSGRKVVNGLSKIARSLRAKGEAFAADVVEATSLSIKKDLRKDASRNSMVVLGLKKLAREFDDNGDSLASDMVRVTINKIANRPDMPNIDDMMEGGDFPGEGDLDEQLKKKVDRSKFAKTEEEAPAQVQKADAASKGKSAMEAMDILFAHGVEPKPGGGYHVELQDGTKVLVH